MKKITGMIVIAIVLFLAFASQGYADEIKAFVNFVRSTDPLVVKMVKEKTGIDIVWSRSSFNEMDAKMQGEAPNFSIDMMIGCGIQSTLRAKQEGWSLPYVSPTWKDIPARFKDPKGHFYSMGQMSYVFVGNKERLAKAGYEMPKSWKDLLDPKWKGEIVAPSPLNSGIGGVMLLAFLELYGEEEGWKYMEKLNNQMHHYTKNGNTPTELVGRGEFLIGITSDEQIIQRISDGYPIVWSRPIEGTGFITNNVQIMRNTKKPELAKKIIDLLGTEDMQRLLSRDLLTARPLPHILYGKDTPKFIVINEKKLYEDRARIYNIWKKNYKHGVE